MATSFEIKSEPSKLSTLYKALVINCRMRQLLQEDIEKLKEAKKKNERNMAILQELLSADKSEKDNEYTPINVRSISTFAAPYFRDVNKMVPPLNADAVVKHKNCDVNAYMNVPAPWNPIETKNLMNGIAAFALSSALKPYQLKRNHLRSKLMDKNTTEDEEEALINQLADIEQIMKCISKKPLNELLSDMGENIDWMDISSVNLEGLRKPEECESYWKNYLNFNINKAAFTEAEDSQLKSLAKQHKERDWDTIAKYLNTNRSAIQCFERYQTKLSHKFNNRYWTKEEDQYLIELVEKMKIGNFIPWSKVSLYIDGRTRQQIINRYERSICQMYNRGPWTSEEDAILHICIQKFGLRWADMRPFFQRRSTYSIRERYVNALDPSIKLGVWTKEEDINLITLIRKYGYGKWSKICKHIPGRTDNMCLVRASRLLAHSVKFHLKKYNVEYDTSVFDPKLFAKILRPIAPTKNCKTRCLKRKTDQETAIDTLIEALNNILPSLNVERKDKYVYDFSFLTIDQLHDVSEELHRMLKERESNVESIKPRIRYFKNVPIPRKQVVLSDLDSEVEYQEENSETFSKEKKLWLDGVLNNLFRSTAKILPPSRKKTFQAQNSREVAESTLYKAYLYKQFRCKALCDKEDDLENVVFNGVDYSETLQTVVSYFIQPPVYDNQSIILSPNMASMGALECIEATEERMQIMSEFVHYSEPYMDYINGKSLTSPSCLQCLHKKNIEIPTQVTPEVMLSDLTKKYFMIDEKMKNAAYVESACLDQCPDICCCEALKKSWESVQLLQQRFMGLFLWPSLLASTNFTKEQDDILCNPTRSEAEKNYYLRMKERGRPLGSKNKINTFGKRKLSRKCTMKVKEDLSLSNGETSAKRVPVGIEHELEPSGISGLNDEMQDIYKDKKPTTYVSKVAPSSKKNCTKITRKFSKAKNAQSIESANSILTNITKSSVKSELLGNVMKNLKAAKNYITKSTESPEVQNEMFLRNKNVKKRQWKRKTVETLDGKLRRSKRLCVLNRTSFSYLSD